MLYMENDERVIVGKRQRKSENFGQINNPAFRVLSGIRDKIGETTSSIGTDNAAVVGVNGADAAGGANDDAGEKAAAGDHVP